MTHRKALKYVITPEDAKAAEGLIMVRGKVLTAAEILADPTFGKPVVLRKKTIRVAPTPTPKEETPCL